MSEDPTGIKQYLEHTRAQTLELYGVEPVTDDDCKGVVLARFYQHRALREHFPGWKIMTPVEPKVGHRFKRALVLFRPTTPVELNWLEDMRLTLPPGGQLEYLV